MSKDGLYWFLCGFGLGMVAALLWAMPQQLEMARRATDLERDAAAVRAKLADLDLQHRALAAAQFDRR